MFHGVERRHANALLRALKERGVGAALGAELDAAVRVVIRELGVAESVTAGDARTSSSSTDMDRLQSKALELALLGDIGKLRQLSQQSHWTIPNARSVDERTCLHFAAQGGHVDLCRWLLSEVHMSVERLDAAGKSPIDVAAEANQEEAKILLTRWAYHKMVPCDNTKGSSVGNVSPDSMPTLSNASNKSKDEEKDVYRHIEQQLRSIRTMKQLHALLQKNRCPVNHPPNDNGNVTHVLGCHIHESDQEHERQCLKSLAEEHGAVLLRNFIRREVDQLALTALALRHMNFDFSGALKKLHSDVGDNSFNDATTLGCKGTTPKAERKRTSKSIEALKSQMKISADDYVIVQTNFGPQMQSHPADAEQRNFDKQKMKSFPLSRLRYVNLGIWNYNWGDRRYEKVPRASALPNTLVTLAQRAYEFAREHTNEAALAAPVPFDMAICNLYHLQRPSDRLGGHRDNVESDLSLPLVTFSLGAPGIFLLGRTARCDKPTAILLRAGDCMVMSGKSRRYFHGVPTVLQLDGCEGASDDTDLIGTTVFPELNKLGIFEGTGKMSSTAVPSLDELRFAKAFLSTVRMNMSIRKV